MIDLDAILQERQREIQHPVPASMLVHIGDMTVSFAVLEMTLRSLIGSLIAEHQRVGQIITAELAFKQLRALAISLYKERHGEDADYDQLRELMVLVGKLEERRNQITHSIWGAGGAADIVTRIKTSAKEVKGLSFQSEKVSKQDLANFASAIKAIAYDLRDFQLKLLSTSKAINNPFEKIW